MKRKEKEDESCSDDAQMHLVCRISAGVYSIVSYVSHNVERGNSMEWGTGKWSRRKVSFIGPRAQYITPFTSMR